MTVVRPFELPDGRLVVQLITLGPGLCGGDVVRINVTALDGARVIVTTTAATKIMSMADEVMPSSTCGCRRVTTPRSSTTPPVTIPFPGSALETDGAVTAGADGARRRDRDAGRSAARRAANISTSGRSPSRTTLTVDDRLLYADTLDLEPAVNDVAGAGVLSNRRYLAAGFWLGVDNVGELPAVPEGTAATEVAFGQTAPGLVYLRALGDDGPAMDAMVQRSAELASLAWGVTPVRLDRFRC